MQKFSKKQIALAVSASLLAGSALAASGDAATLVSKNSHPLLITAVNGGTAGADVAKLYSAKGSQDAVTFNLGFTVDVADTLLITAAASLNTTNADNTKRNVAVYTGTLSDTTLLATTSASLVGSTLTVNLPALAGTKAYRLSSGKLQYTADGATWADIKVDVKSVTGATQIWVEKGNVNTTLDTGAGDVELAATVVQAKNVENSLVPTAKVTTRATNGLVDGIVIDTLGTLSSLAATNLTVVVNNAGDVDNGGTDIVAKASVAYAATKGTVKFDTPTTVDWTIGDAAADAKAYASKSFNTGVNGGTVPFTVAVKVGTEPVFSDIYNGTTGAADVKLNTANLGTVEDGAAPVLLAASFAAGDLTLSLSEPVQFTGIGGAANNDNIRKILENVTLAGTKLAADFQLRNAAATAAINAPASNKGELVISGLGASRTDVEGKAVAVLPTIALNDAFSTQDTALLDSVGVSSVSGVDEGASGSVTATAVNTIGWASGTARAYYSTQANEAGLIKKIVVDLGKPLSLKASGSLDKTFKVVFGAVNALENAGGYTFNWFPAAGEYAIVGNTIEFTLPTALLRSNLKGVGDAVIRTSVEYLGSTATVASPLQAAFGATKVDVGDDVEDVILPLSASTAAQGLYTMDVKADLKAPAGSKVTAYLAKWVDSATAAAATTSVQSGKVSIPGDKWATDVALSLDNGFGGSVSTLESAVNDQLKAAKPAAVPAWIVVNRSNDLVKGGSNNGNNNENYLVASATLYGDAATATGAATNNQSTVFEVAVDPKTGNISGRLTGNIKLKNTAGNTNNRGLVFINKDGSLANAVGVNTAQTQALVDATGKARFLIGAGPKKDLKDAGAVFKDAFVLLVGETQNDDGSSSYKLLTSAEPSLSNFLPFNANLVTGNDALGTVTLDVANIKSASLANTGSWQLVGAGNLDRSAKAAAAISLPRLLVGLNGSNAPTSFWTNDTAATDIALTLLGNKSGVAVEASDKDVNTVADKANTKANAFAFAFANDVAAAGNKLFFLTKTAEAPALPVGWALVAANATSLPSDVSMALFAGSNHVGIGSSWATGDAAATLTVGQPVFVYAKKAIAGK